MPKYHCLTLIATPIGNLQELSALAKTTLANASIIICEDTRVTKKLLKLAAIDYHQKLISYNKMSEHEKLAKILNHLELEPCVLVSDAGYPVISDPGYLVVKELRKHNCLVRVINGPCALIHALVGSGIDSRKFYFANFLPKKPAQRIRELQELLSISYVSTIVYYEPLNYLLQGLALLQKVFGDIQIGISRELSKLNETQYYGLISELINQVKLKGEFVIIIPRQTLVVNQVGLNELLKQVQSYVSDGMKLKHACKLVENFDYKASQLYKAFLENKCF